MKEKDRDSLRFLWVENLDDKKFQELIMYRSCRVIFGAGPSPFILSGVLQHHLEQYRREDPKFTEKLKKNFFVDDLVTTFEHVNEAYQTYVKAMQRMKEGGFVMRKWKSNNKELMELIEKHQKGEKSTEASERVTVDSAISQADKVLGLTWNQQEDKIQIHLKK